MGSFDNDRCDEFEGFRRDRKRRRNEAGPRRDLGKHPTVLRQIEQAEAAEAHNERISREVHEFFSDATRTAAEIVARVSEHQEEKQVVHVQQDMVDFLTDAIQRASHLVTQLQMEAGFDSIATTELQTDLHNIIGRQLDKFRSEGTAQLHDKHIGQDPFATEIDDGARPARSRRDDDAHDEPVEIEEHLVAELLGDTADAEDPDEESAVMAWLDELREDMGRLQASMKCLVGNQLMSKAQAIDIYRELGGAV